MGAAFDVAAKANDQVAPAIAYSGSAAQYLVAWQTYVDVTALNDVRARWVGREGELPDAAFGVATGTDDQRAPDAACAGNGVCLVTWER